MDGKDLGLPVLKSAAPFASLKVCTGSDAPTEGKSQHTSKQIKDTRSKICLKTVHTPAPGYFKYL